MSAAKDIIHGDREEVYGHPNANIKRIAELWTVVLGAPISMEQVCLCMAALKLARLINDPDHIDSRVDLCGYIALMERLHEPIQ